MLSTLRQAVRRFLRWMVGSDNDANEIYLSMIEEAALAIEGDEPSIRERLQRLKLLASRIAASLNLSRDERDLLLVGSVLVGCPRALEKVRFPIPLDAALRSRREKFDGQGEAIPIVSRVLSVLEAFDILTSARHEGSPLPPERALERLRDDAGASFDPRIISLLSECASGLTITPAPEAKDPPTQLPDARYLFSSFQKEINQAVERQAPLSLLMLDIDNFHEINRQLGRAAGDRVLRGVARAIRSQLRPCDTCVRYRGDEFIISVPGVGPDGVGALQVRIDMAIAKHKFVVVRGKTLRVTIEFGHATFPEDGRSFDALLAVTETRLRAERAAHSRSSGDDADLRHRFPTRTDFPLN